MTAETTIVPEAFTGADRKWSEKMNRLRNRKPTSRTIVFHDDDAAEKAHESLVAGGHIEARIRKEANAMIEADPELSALPVQEKITLVAEQMDQHSEVIAAREKTDALEALAAEAADTITILALGSDVWEELVSAHPPTKAQEQQGMDYNVTTFAPALVAASLTDPITVEEASELMSVLNQGEAALLFQACVGVNQSARATLGKG